MKKKATLYTAEGLAEKIDLSYSRLRAILSQAKGETELKGYKLVKTGNSWLAYDPTQIELEIADASPEFKEKNRRYRSPITRTVNKAAGQQELSIGLEHTPPEASAE